MSLKNRLLAATLSTVMLSVSVPAMAAEDQTSDSPSSLAIVGDALVARPLLLVGTALGAGIFVVSLPFSALGGNVGESADLLVVGPAKSTFTRCLGCTETQDKWKKARMQAREDAKKQ